MIKNYLDSNHEAAWGVSVSTWPVAPGVLNPAPDKNQVLVQVEDFGLDTYARCAMTAANALSLAAALAACILHCSVKGNGDLHHRGDGYEVMTDGHGTIVILLADHVAKPGSKVTFPMTPSDAHDMVGAIGRAAYRILFHDMGKEDQTSFSPVDFSKRAQSAVAA